MFGEVLLDGIYHMEISASYHFHREQVFYMVIIVHIYSPTNG